MAYFGVEPVHLFEVGTVDSLLSSFVRRPDQTTLDRAPLSGFANHVTR